MSFNYLGQLNSAAPAGAPLLAPTGAPTGPARSPRARRDHLLAVSGLVAGGRLRLAFSYSTRVHRRATIEALAGSVSQLLGELITRCQGVEEPVLTASDFSLLDLDDAAFSKIAGLLADGEGD